MNVTERRERFRAVLAGDECIYPAPVFDPVSARIAEDLGFEIGYFAEPAAEATVLGGPNFHAVLLSLSELAQQARRICRASNISLEVEAYSGFGNALNVMRTVEELEIAGVSALTIEDTVMPIGFAGAEEMQFRLTVDPLISLEEGIGKMKAAVAARKDPSLVIVGRTRALHLPIGGVPETIRRVKAYEKAGVDAINLSGLGSLEQLEAIHAETKLPLVCGTWLGTSDKRSVDKQFLAAHGLRMEQPGHLSLFAAMKAEYDILKALRDGAAPAELRIVQASPELQGQVLRKAQYNEWIKNFLS